VDGIVFNAGASAFTITASRGNFLQFWSVGITNNSGIAQTFVAAGDAFGSGIIFFSNGATAGNGTFINEGGTVAGAFAGSTIFENTSTAGNGTFTNNAGAVSGGLGGSTAFGDTSTAGNATLIANGGLGGNAGGSISFGGASTGGTARVEVFGDGTGDTTNGNLDISFHNAPGVAVGSIEGSGAVFLGANNLTVGSNNLTRVFSGLMQDGGQNGGAGGSLTKIGRGKMKLTRANTYTGGTTIEGRLFVNNTSGSGTGTGAVQVNDDGVLSGMGVITGTVTVGTGTRSGAVLLPGKGETTPAALTINSALTFNSLSTYKCVLDRRTPIAGKVSALGVTINSGATFTFVDTGTGTLMTGTVFTVIDNTSGSPIAGTFSNLANGSVFTSNGNNFQASYTGGTGNDLTLTVVP
jgi:hypothetical protein